MSSASSAPELEAPRTAEGAFFELRGATVRYAAGDALRGVDLAVAPGERVAVVGPSGAGKTTLLSLFNATVVPSEGAVLVDGRRLAELGPRELRELRSRVGFVHQEHALVPNVRVVQNVLAGRLGRRGFWGALRAMVRPAAREVEEVHAVLERVGLAEKLYQRTDTLSGGQRQRVAIARALFQAPAGLLADEPLASVDPARARDLARLLTDIAEERGLALIASLHDMTIAREFFPRLVGLRGGRVVFDTCTDAVDVDRLEDLFRLEDRFIDG